MHYYLRSELNFLDFEEIFCKGPAANIFSPYSINNKVYYTTSEWVAIKNYWWHVTLLTLNWFHMVYLIVNLEQVLSNTKSSCY